MRLRARNIKSLPYKTDDYVILLALCLSISIGGTVLYGAFKTGYGQNILTMTAAEFAVYSWHAYLTVLLSQLAIGTVKISVITFYKRIFRTQSFHRAANILLGFVVAWILATSFTHIFSAWPISNWWKIEEHFDMNYGAYSTAFAAMDIALDIATLCLPIPVIKSLHLSTTRKFALAGIFWLGIFCVVSSAVRLYFAYELSLAGTARHTSDNHYSYVAVNMLIWSEIEPCASIIAGCLPTFGPLVTGGHSIPNLARSIKFHIFKRMGSISNLPQQSNIGFPDSQPNEEFKVRRAWFQLQNKANTTLHTGDIEQRQSEILRPDPVFIQVQSTRTSEIEQQ
ncbi:MAG: integral membrane [Lasallia pustulata]|uniref:Integral membrane n=1 Tax=Lasallia pustulata TaxID=136370 RepID=A0A5M8PHA7_9LECA|nr:MAG: integral membrane [Lasallia pustulata]